MRGKPMTCSSLRGILSHKNTRYKIISSRCPFNIVITKVMCIEISRLIECTYLVLYKLVIVGAVFWCAIVITPPYPQKISIYSNFYYSVEQFGAKC